MVNDVKVISKWMASTTSKEGVGVFELDGEKCHLLLNDFEDYQTIHRLIQYNFHLGREEGIKTCRKALGYIT